MGRPTRGELEQENELLRDKLREIADAASSIIDDEEEDSVGEDDDDAPF